MQQIIHFRYDKLSNKMNQMLLENKYTHIDLLIFHNANKTGLVKIRVVKVKTRKKNLKSFKN